jgi:hypothetical protein
MSTTISGSSGSQVYNGFFGQTLTTANNGDLLAISSPLSTDNANTWGAVAVYDTTEIPFNQIQTIYNPNYETTNQGFGNSLAFSENGQFLVIGATNIDPYGTGNGGIALYALNNGVYRPNSIEVPFVSSINSENNGINNDTFGRRMRMSADGSLVIATGLLNFNYEQPSAAYVNCVEFYTIINPTTSPTLSLFFSANETPASNADINFGNSISVNYNGQVVAIGNPGSTQNNTGQVCLFYKQPDGSYLRTLLTPPASLNYTGNNFGAIAELSYDGTLLFVTNPNMPYTDVNNNTIGNVGQVFVFSLNPNDSTVVPTLIQSFYDPVFMSDYQANPSSAIGYSFGQSLSISKDNAFLVVNSDQLRVFKQIAGQYVYQKSLRPQNTNFNSWSLNAYNEIGYNSGITSVAVDNLKVDVKTDPIEGTFYTLYAGLTDYGFMQSENGQGLLTTFR